MEIWVRERVFGGWGGDGPWVLVLQVVGCGAPGGASAVAERIHGLVDQSGRIGICGKAIVLALEVLLFRVARDGDLTVRRVHELAEDLVKSALAVGTVERGENVLRYLEEFVLLAKILADWDVR